MKQPRKLSSPLSRAAVFVLAGICLAIVGLIIFVPPPGEKGLADHPAEGGSAEGDLRHNGGPEGFAGADTSAPYRPLPTLESLIGSTRQRMEFRVLSPGETVPRGTLIVFRWEDNDGGPWKVAVLDNRGVAIQEEEVKAPDFTLSSPKPGLYYWTVSREDRLLHIGRVAVR